MEVEEIIQNSDNHEFMINAVKQTGKYLEYASER